MLLVLSRFFFIQNVITLSTSRELMHCIMLYETKELHADELKSFAQKRRKI